MSKWSILGALSIIGSTNLTSRLSNIDVVVPGIGKIAIECTLRFHGSKGSSVGQYLT